jgi:hypothetical protein
MPCALSLILYVHSNLLADTKVRCEYKRQAKKRGKVSNAPAKRPHQDPSQQKASEPLQVEAHAQIEAMPISKTANTNISWIIREQENQPTNSIEPNLNPMFNHTPADGTLGAQLDIWDDYQMFNSDSGWRSQDYGDGFPNFEVPQTVSPTNNNAGIRETSQADIRPNVGSMESTDAMQRYQSAGRSVVANQSKGEVYGIHWFDPTDIDEETHPSASQSLPSIVNVLSFSRSGRMNHNTSETTRSTEPRRLGSSHPQTTPVLRPLRAPGAVRYPVLQETIHFLRPLIPDALAYDLLEAYFQVSPVTNAQLAPCAPPLVYRKQLFLRQDQPRRCTPVLLVSMLWLSAQTADIPVLNASIARRKYVRRKLLVLTTQLLKPLNEVSGNEIPRNPRSSSLPHSPDRPSGIGEAISDSGLTDALDEIMAYVHLAMVTTASEFKGASLRWWNIAFSLSHEAKLHQEIADSFSSGMSEAECYDGLSSSPNPHESESYEFIPMLSEERKEERRRVWWFLYTMDRHLSFSFNKPLSLLDSECQHLRRPCDDAIWQSDLPFETPPTPSAQGPWFECTGPTFFGFFTPLVALLGEIVYFVGAQNHPRFGVSASTLQDWKKWEKEIADRLDLYQQGMQRLFGSTNTPNEDSEQEERRDFQTTDFAHTSNPTIASGSVNPALSTSSFHNRVACAYGNTIVHVLFILLMGKWDPLLLLNEPDSWLSSPAFAGAISHAVEAANSAETLLYLDPDAHFMPLFIGVYLFQGSLPLLLVADRLGQDAAPVIVHAVDTMVRVQETGAMRMPAEYQVFFSTGFGRFECQN